MHSSRMFDRGLGRVIGLRRWDDGRDPSAELRSDQPHGCRKRKGPVSVRTLTTNAGAEVYTTVYTYESMNLHACIHTYYLACAPYPLSPKGLEPPSHLWVGGWLHVAFRRISSCCGRGCFGFNSPPSPSRSLWVGVCVSVYIYICVFMFGSFGGWMGWVWLCSILLSSWVWVMRTRVATLNDPASLAFAFLCHGDACVHTVVGRKVDVFVVSSNTNSHSPASKALTER